ncbi:MAG: DNA primase small subunit domain-containing protein [Promethearchaeota archaeon]
MTDETFLKRLFEAYYREKHEEIPKITDFSKREFGFIPFDNSIMIRHIGFRDKEDLIRYLIKNSPRHVYSSGSLYKYPDAPTMDKKLYQFCDFIIDIDVDHFYTPCKNDHDFWYCQNCGAQGSGMIKSCPKCKKKKIDTLTWICNKCLEISKEELLKAIYNFLIPDFGIREEEMHIAFSGHRGYHLKIENNKMRQLSSEERREIVNFITGHNIDFEVLGFQVNNKGVTGLLGSNVGWPKKIIDELKKILNEFNNRKLKSLLISMGIPEKTSESFVNSRDYFYKIISNNKALWSIEGFGKATWEILLSGIVERVGVEIDEPVSIDIHRLIRYPGSLHGKTGFKVQELTFNQIDDFNPLDEANSSIDPIVFYSKKNYKLKIIAEMVPRTNIKGEQFGPYQKDEIIEVPNHIAVLLLSKGVAKIL